MCRERGRRCEWHWDQRQRRIYNAKRRVSRNTAKRDKALAAGDEALAEKYDKLVLMADRELAELR